ncbi:hypothetical protein SLEP1_g6900 [Rubroshorea leprosula]|uniref:Uncharacterized protein n=1 Tax=Rubroshorea leprosula TaxID=152421 RepID=A0AAV5I7M0_9ROSI|nr:hypothetical protein SLEP1_g6900 [Rubroshorea leprosula]
MLPSSPEVFSVSFVGTFAASLSLSYLRSVFTKGSY